MRWLRAKEAAINLGMTPETMYRWARKGHVLSKRLARGHGPLLVAVDADGLPLDGAR